jgi:predicted nucleic acid-binding protein
MIVVSNTSPLTNLAAIGQFDLLHRLYGRVHIAEGVWEELNAGGRRWPGRYEVAAANWIERRPVQNRWLVTALQRDLDRGEAETIALALELGAEVVLLDEREGRRVAQRLGLRVVGVVGILLEAKSNGAITAVRPYLDSLRHTAGFYLDDALYSHALLLAGEGEE